MRTSPITNPAAPWLDQNSYTDYESQRVRTCTMLIPGTRVCVCHPNWEDMNFKITEDQRVILRLTEEVISMMQGIMGINLDVGAAYLAQQKYPHVLLYVDGKHITEEIWLG
jgi:hypothetical protein